MPMQRRWAVAMMAGLCGLPEVVGLVVLRPAGLGPFDHVTAGFGPELPREGIASEVVWPVPVDACQPVSGCVDLKSPPASWASFDPAKQPGRRSTKELCAGAIIMIRRGNCDFFKKILNAQAVGAAAVVVYGNTESEELITMAAEPDEVGMIDIPSVYVTKKTGETLVGAHVMLNMTGELPMGDDQLPGMDSLVSPWRRDHIMPGAISDKDYMKSDVIQIMIEPPPFSTTTVVDNHGSIYSPQGGAGGLGGCSSLDGPHCMRIKAQFAELSDEELAGIEETQEEMMAALEDEIAAALKQVGAGAAGADIPALLESIMGAMASSASPGQGGGMMNNMITIGTGSPAGGKGPGKGKDDDVLEVNLFGTKFLLPKDAGAPLPNGGGAGVNSGRPSSSANAATGERPAGAKGPGSKPPVGHSATAPPSPPAGSASGAAKGSSRAGADSKQTPPKDQGPEEIELEDDDL